LAAWSGRGQLLDALAAVADDGGKREWSAADIRRRAHRILIAAMAPAVASWPERATTWLDALPAESLRSVEDAPAPRAGVMWAATRRAGRWPPESFVIRHRHRVADTLLVSVLRWVLTRVEEARRDALSIEPYVDAAISTQLDVALGLLDEEPLLSANAIRPDRHDLLTVRREGRPWVGVAEVGEMLLDLEGSLSLWAARMIYPDPELRWRLFHLGVFGTLLSELRARGCECTSRRPLSASGPAPAYEVVMPDGTTWDLWFEAGGIWSRYKRQSPYMATTAGLPGASQPLEPDILLVRPDCGVFVVECKYSASASTVGRGGVPQVMAYAVEAKTTLAEVVRGAVVSPTGRTTAPTTVQTSVGLIGVMAPEDLGGWLDDFFVQAGAPAAGHVVAT